MKKLTLALGLLIVMTVPALAGGKKKAVKQPPVATAQAVEQMPVVPPSSNTGAAATTLTPENMAFKSESHDFGTVTEGAAADYNFTFTNTGSEPILIQKAQPSCGCTASDWTKEPILPGKTGYVKASYGTQGRPGPFAKTVTVLSNAGAKVLTFKGEVEKAPTGSMPENHSMIKTN